MDGSWLDLCSPWDVITPCAHRNDFDLQNASQSIQRLTLAYRCGGRGKSYPAWSNRPRAIAGGPEFRRGKRRGFPSTYELFGTVL